MRFTLKDDEYWIKSDNQYKAYQKLGRIEDIEKKHNIKSVEDLDKRLTALEIIVKYPKNTHSINYLLYMMKYWEEIKEPITKKLLQIHDIPYEVEEFELLKEILYEKFLRKNDCH